MHVNANLASQDAHNVAIEFFGTHLDEFQRPSSRQSHATSTIGQYLRCIGTLAMMMKAHGIGARGLDKAQAVRAHHKDRLETGTAGPMRTSIVKALRPVPERTRGRQAAFASYSQRRSPGRN